uniref:Uncharacterized protein n=1 Tax=Ditylenchus dipsaci TaxID=166011 RepID=A0A915EIF1_9BILA
MFNPLVSSSLESNAILKTHFPKMALTIKFLLRDFAEWTTIPGPIQIVYALNSLFRFLWTVDTRFQKEAWTRKALVLLAAQLPNEVIEEATYSFDEFVKFCYFNNLPCPRSSFSSYIDATYGACYQFNVPNLSDFQTYRAGSDFALRILLLIKQVDPSGNLIYLPTTNTAGVRINVQNLDVDPAIDSFGVNCAVGKEVMVTLQMKKVLAISYIVFFPTSTTLMKSPYGECVDNAQGAANYYSQKAYTIENCLRSCKQNLALFVCGCADPKYNKPDNSSYCDVGKIACLLGLHGQRGNNSFSPVRDCGCFPPCEEFDVQMSVSQANFPSKKFAVLDVPDSDPVSYSLSQYTIFRLKFSSYSCANPNSLFGGDSQRCIQWHRQNSLVLNFWYDGLDYEAQDEQASYTLTQASNDLGGNMGVWLGISVISVIEVIALIIMIILFLVYGRKVRIAPSQEEFDEDVRYKNIQDLKDELDKHEKIDDRVRNQIEKQNRDTATKRAQLKVQIGRAREMVSQATAKLQEAQATSTQNPNNVAALAALANANAVANATLKHLKQLQQSYSLL